MKKLIAILTILTSINVTYAIDSIPVVSKIIDVTVFSSGAQITRQFELKFSKGKHLILLDKLPQDINPQSIQVNGIDGCKILSVKHSLKYPNGKVKSNEEVEIQSKIDAFLYKIKEIKNKSNVYDIEEKLLLDNSILKNEEQGSMISDIKEAADFYRLRLNEIRQAKLYLFSELEAANKRKQELYNELNEITLKKQKTYSQILITLDCEKDLSSKMNFSYYIPMAGWEPLYDFRVDDITKPLSIIYNANVFQSSGEDWNNVNIKLSTNNPSLSENKPELNTWYVDRYSQSQNSHSSNIYGILKGRVFDNETDYPIAFANVIIYKDNDQISTVQTDIDGNFTIKPMKIGFYSARVSFVGYNTEQMKVISINSDKTTSIKFYLKTKVDLNDGFAEIPVRTSEGIVSTMAGVQGNDGQMGSVRGQRPDGTVTYIDGVKVVGKAETTNYISNTLKSNTTNLEYTIDIPYTIPSDGETYNIKIKEVNLPVNYKHHSVPKLENDAFLTAEISDWSQLNLLSGKSNIYFQGTYTGESYIDVNQVSDTLAFSLGRDRNIIIKRESNKEMNDKQIFGSKIKEIVGWNITVRNNKSSKIKIIIEDQYPISEKKSIEVELLESSNAKIDEKTGKLTWEIEIEPNDKKVLTYKYSVKYPKDSNIFME